MDFASDEFMDVSVAGGSFQMFSRAAGIHTTTTVPGAQARVCCKCRIFSDSSKEDHVMLQFLRDSIDKSNPAAQLMILASTESNAAMRKAQAQTQTQTDEKKVTIASTGIGMYVSSSTSKPAPTRRNAGLDALVLMLQEASVEELHTILKTVFKLRRLSGQDVLGDLTRLYTSFQFRSGGVVEKVAMFKCPLTTHVKYRISFVASVSSILKDLEHTEIRDVWQRVGLAMPPVICMSLAACIAVLL